MRKLATALCVGALVVVVAACGDRSVKDQLNRDNKNRGTSTVTSRPDLIGGADAPNSATTTTTDST